MDYARAKDGLYAELHTSKGLIVISLEHERAPLTVANFVGLAEGNIPNRVKPPGVPYYDGLPFHTVVADFLIQSGAPPGHRRGGPGYRFRDEFESGIKFNRPGILGMANAGPNTNGSQFFITCAAAPLLNGRHTAFGRVVQGKKVVSSIVQGDRIETIAIKRRGAALQNYDPPPDMAREIMTIGLDDG